MGFRGTVKAESTQPACRGAATTLNALKIRRDRPTT